MERAKRARLDGRLTVIAGPEPPTPEGLCSTRVQILHWRVDAPFADAAPHLHSASDEVYVVIDGAIDVETDGETHRIGPNESLAVPAGVLHSLTRVHFPARGLTIRGPAVDDKETPASSAPHESPEAPAVAQP